MKLVAIALFSWVAGLGAYTGALSAFWGQQMSAGDFRAVLFWSALAATAAIAVGYAPAMFALRALLDGRGRSVWWAYPSVGIALGALPVLLIMSVWSANIGSALLTPEAALFYCMFGAFGATFGVGFFIAYGRSSTKRNPSNLLS